MGKTKNTQLKIETLKDWLQDKKLNKGRPKPQKIYSKSTNG
jgi:hypothetical protein